MPPHMSRLSLAQVTLCAVDTHTPALATQSLLRSMAHVHFGRVILFTNGWVPRQVLPGIELVEIDPIETPADHSLFVMRRLPAYIRSSHVLLTQWDAFVTRPAAWNHEFLVHDYVGAPWPGAPEATAVGQGGFSLRSRRYLAAGLDPRIAQVHPEDEVLTRQQRQHLQGQHGIRFAPAAVARRFVAGGEDSFGFLGAQHLPRWLGENEIRDCLARLPDEFFGSDAASQLARALVRHGMAGTARQLLRRRSSAGAPLAAGDRLLGAAASLMSALPGFRAR
jgi:hypothetical protein